MPSLSSLFAKLRGGLDITRVALSALELIGKLATGKAIDRRQAREARPDRPHRRAHQGRHRRQGNIHEVEAELDKMRKDIAGNNTTVDDEADDKFDDGSDT